jgi:hypothetical protein
VKSIIGIFFVDNNKSAFELVVVRILASQSTLWGLDICNNEYAE